MRAWPSARGSLARLNRIGKAAATAAEGDDDDSRRGGDAGGSEEGEEDEAAKWERERAAMEAEAASHEDAKQQTKGWRIAASTFRKHVYDSAGYEPPEQKLERTHATLQRTVKLFNFGVARVLTDAASRRDRQ